VRTKKRGFSFGAGRLNFGSPLEAVHYIKDLPGPGQYKSYSPLNVRDITLKPRLPDSSLSGRKLLPGPGTYDPPSSINSDGRYVCSKYGNSRCTRIDPQHKHSEKTPRTPGPGQCTCKLIQTTFTAISTHRASTRCPASRTRERGPSPRVSGCKPNAFTN
jgi:hypothetical protein